MIIHKMLQLFDILVAVDVTNFDTMKADIMILLYSGLYKFHHLFNLFPLNF